MPPSFSITEIRQDLSDIASSHIRIGYGQNSTLSTSKTVIWTPTQPLPGPNPPHVAHAPIAFTLLQNAQSVPLEVDLECQNFPGGEAQYYLQGSGPGNGNLRIRSEAFTITSNAAVQYAIAASFGFINLGTIQSPFCVKGDWTWSIHRQSDNGLVASSARTTRLEIYWFLSDTTTNGDHLLDLIRIVVPDFTLVTNVTWVQLQPTIVQNITGSLWGLGSVMCRYDNRINMGGSSYHMSGTELNLQTLMGFPNLRCLVNCVDLAALVVVAFRALGHRAGSNQDLLPAQTESRTIWGYVQEGPLFGWIQPAYLNCNSPFWTDPFFNDLGAWNYPVDSRDHLSRQSFRMHTYAVYKDGQNNELVADVCQAKVDAQNGEVIPSRNVSRTQYYTDSIDIVEGRTTIGNVRT